MSTKTNEPKVCIGSVWADNSHPGRRIRVEGNENGYAVCRVLTNSDRVQRDLDQHARTGWPFNVRDMRGGFTRIRLDRFRPTPNGYTFILNARTAAISDELQARIERKRHRQLARKSPAQPVTVGSYWQDAFLPGYGRVVKVMDVDDTHATIMTLVNDHKVQRDLDLPPVMSGNNYPRDMRGTVRRVLLDRFRPTLKGFLPVTDGPAEIAHRDHEAALQAEAAARYAAHWYAPDWSEGEDAFRAGFDHVPDDETFVL